MNAAPFNGEPVGLVPATPEELAAFAAVLGPGRRLVGALLMFDCKATDGSGKVKWAPQPGGVQEVMGTLARIEGKVDVVLKDYQEVRTAKERLQQMAAAGLLRFTKRVNVSIFRSYMVFGPSLINVREYFFLSLSILNSEPIMG